MIIVQSGSLEPCKAFFLYRNERKMSLVYSAKGVQHNYTTSVRALSLNQIKITLL